MVDNPNIEILAYNMYEHEDKVGWPCHGQHDNSSDVRTMHRINISRDIVVYVESCFSLGVSIDTVYKFQIKRHVDMDVAARDSDFFLSKKYTINICNRMSKGKYQLHQKNEMSVNLWYQKYHEDFFFYQNPNGVEVPFIMGIHTKWMLEIMVKLSHNSLIARNKYGISWMSNIDSTCIFNFASIQYY